LRLGLLPPPIIHGVPKRSVSMPKASTQKVLSSGMRTCPPLAIDFDAGMHDLVGVALRALRIRGRVGILQHHLHLAVQRALVEAHRLGAAAVQEPIRFDLPHDDFLLVV
jgi:hypothetical protein